MEFSDVLDSATLYRLWQMPFRRAKVTPLIDENDLTSVRRVLDVGCGPGTNSDLFSHTNYLGIDLSEKYVTFARRRFSRDFQVADARDYLPPAGRTYDFILVNSLLHHMNDEDTRRILRTMEQALCEDGTIHIIDLLTPECGGIPRLLARRDRGSYARPLAQWKEVFCEFFTPRVVKPFWVSLFGLRLWNLVYFKGGRRIHG